MLDLLVLEGSVGASGATHPPTQQETDRIVASDQKEGLTMGFDTLPSSKNWGRYAHGTNLWPPDEQCPRIKSVVET